MPYAERTKVPVSKSKAEIETLVRVCISEHGAQCADPAPELSRLWDLVGVFNGNDIAEAERQAKNAAPQDDTMEGDLDSWDGI